MGKRTTQFISALFASILVGTPLSAVSQTKSGSSVDRCLTSPGSTTPQGQHWYYRTNSDTNRRCWYLGESEDPVAKSTARKPNSSTSRPVRDAHAQLAPDSNPDTAAPNEAQAQQVAQTAPSNNTAAEAAPSQPEEQPAAEQPAPEVTVSPSLADTTPAATDVSAEKPTPTLQMLLFVIGAALTLAGIIGVVVFSFGGSRKRAKGARRVNWGPVADNDDEAPPAHPAAGSSRPPKRLPPLSPSTPAAGTATLAASTTEARTTPPQRPAKRPTTIATEPDAKAVAASAKTEADEMDIDAITAMLERLVNDGPKLSRPISAAGPADFGQSRRGRPGARA